MADNATWTTNLTFDEAENFNTTFQNDVQLFDTTMDQITEVVTSDHTKLTNRDAAQQHPITAITDLAPELDARPSTAMTNMDILKIMQS